MFDLGSFTSLWTGITGLWPLAGPPRLSHCVVQHDPGSSEGRAVWTCLYGVKKPISICCRPAAPNASPKARKPPGSGIPDAGCSPYPGSPVLSRNPPAALACRQTNPTSAEGMGQGVLLASILMGSYFNFVRRARGSLRCLATWLELIKPRFVSMLFVTSHAEWELFDKYIILIREEMFEGGTMSVPKGGDALGSKMPLPPTMHQHCQCCSNWLWFAQLQRHWVQPGER